MESSTSRRSEEESSTGIPTRGTHVALVRVPGFVFCWLVCLGFLRILSLLTLLAQCSFHHRWPMFGVVTDDEMAAVGVPTAAGSTMIVFYHKTRAEAREWQCNVCVARTEAMLTTLASIVAWNGTISSIVPGVVHKEDTNRKKSKMSTAPKVLSETRLREKSEQRQLCRICKQQESKNMKHTWQTMKNTIYLRAGQ